MTPQIAATTNADQPLPMRLPSAHHTADRQEQHGHVAREPGRTQGTGGLAGLAHLGLDLGLGEGELLAHQRRQVLGDIADELADRHLADIDPVRLLVGTGGVLAGRAAGRSCAGRSCAGRSCSGRLCSGRSYCRPRRSRSASPRTTRSTEPTRRAWRPPGTARPGTARPDTARPDTGRTAAGAAPREMKERSPGVSASGSVRVVDGSSSRVSGPASRRSPAVRPISSTYSLTVVEPGRGACVPRGGAGGS